MVSAIVANMNHVYVPHLTFRNSIFNCLLNEIKCLAGKAIISCYPQHQPSHRCSRIKLFHIIDISSWIDMPSAGPHTAINLNRYHQERKGVIKTPFPCLVKLELFNNLNAFKIGLKHLEKEIRCNRLLYLLCHQITLVKPNKLTIKPTIAIKSAIVDNGDNGNSLLCLMQQLSSLV